MEITFNNKKKLVTLNVKNCNFFKKISGLTFTKKENAEILLFDFKKPTRNPIHSLFVFFDFLAIWINEKDEVIEIKKVNPWKLSVSPKNPFVKLIEIPINKKYKKQINQFY